MEKTSCEEYPFSPYIVEIFEKHSCVFQEDPDLTFAQETLCLMNDLIQQFLERLIVEVNIMVKEELEKKEQEFLERLKSDYGVCHAVRRVITGELEIYFESEGNKAVTQYQSANLNEEMKEKTRAEKAKLKLSIDLVEGIMRRSCEFELEDDEGCVYMAGVIEYLTTEIVGCVGEMAMEEDEKIMTVHHLQKGIHNDAELAKLFEEQIEKSLGMGIKGGN